MRSFHPNLLTTQEGLSRRGYDGIELFGHEPDADRQAQELNRQGSKNYPGRAVTARVYLRKVPHFIISYRGSADYKFDGKRYTVCSSASKTGWNPLALDSIRSGIGTICGPMSLEFPPPEVCLFFPGYTPARYRDGKHEYQGPAPVVIEKNHQWEAATWRAEMDENDRKGVRYFRIREWAAGRYGYRSWDFRQFEGRLKRRFFPSFEDMDIAA